VGGGENRGEKSMVENPRSLRKLLIACFALVLVFSLAACERPASKAPVFGEETGMPPLPDEDSIFDNQATATAALTPDAGGGQAEAPAATATPAAEQDAGQPAPAQPAARVVEPTAGPPPATYTLQKGEFPFCIARRFNVNQAELLALNGLTLNSKPVVGTTLRLPQTGNSFVSERSLKAHPTSYTVKSGDTIYTIACQFGDVSPDMIALANDLEAPYNLSSGDVLQIP
jgi:LysM repeat protein